MTTGLNKLLPVSIRPERPAAVSGLASVIVAGHTYRRAAAAHFGLDLIETHVLGVLDEYGPMPQGRLAQHLGLTSGGATGLVDRLERAGTVRRAPDPHDRRRWQVELTERAVQILTESDANLVRVFADLDPEVVATLAEALPRVAAGMDREAERMRG